MDSQDEEAQQSL